MTRDATKPVLALHLGAHKTATTFLQRNFDKGREVMREAGTWYVGPGMLRADDSVRFPNPQSVIDGEADLIAGDTTDALARLVDARVPEGVRRILVSEENILGSSRINLRRAALYPALDARLACLPGSWSRPGTELFLGIRSYADYFTSCQCTVAMQGDWLDLDPDRQRAIAELPRRWTDVVADLRAHFPAADISVWRYEDLALVGPDITRHMAGVPLQVDFKDTGIMASLTAEGMLQVETAWEENGRDTLPRDTVTAIREATVGGHRHDPWGETLRRDLAAAYEEDWSAIQRMCAGQ